MLCVMVCLSVSSCSKTAVKPNKTVFWGTTQEVIEFLQSDKAVSNRWLVEALGG